LLASPVSIGAPTDSVSAESKTWVQVSGFGFRASEFGLRISGFGFRASGFGFRVYEGEEVVGVFREQRQEVGLLLVLALEPVCT